MKFLRNLAPLGAVVALACAPSAQAATGTPVTVRVEGKSRTLLASTLVHVKTGWITRNGATAGECSAASAAGALDQATRHRWGGPFKTSFSDYEILSILGEKTDFTTSFWEIFTGHVASPAGACGTTVHRGEQLVFADVPIKDDGGVYLTAITAVPAHSRAGHAFTVKVVYYDLKGRAHALRGAVVTAGTEKATTNAHGVATLTPAKAGTVVLRASHADTTKAGHRYGYVRAAAVRLRVA